jgi:hypothetical protein
MRRRFVLNENDRNEILKMYGLLLEEISTFEGSTSGEEVSHKKLNTEWGLPYTSNDDESKYYSASMKDVMDKAPTLSQNMKLSMFKPAGNKTESDFFAIQNNEPTVDPATGKKSKSWQKVTTGNNKEFYISGDGVIAGAGNGLLALARALNQMRKSAPFNLLITLGTSTNKQGENERYGSGIDMTVACDLTTSLNRVMDAFVVLSMDPNFRKYSKAILGNINLQDDNQLKNIIKSTIYFITRGDNFFIPTGTNPEEKNKQAIKAGLTPLDDYDFDSIFNDLAALRVKDEFDYENMDNKVSKGSYAPGYGFNNKITKMNEISNTKINQLFEAIKKRYYENFDKWVKTFYQGKSNIKPCLPQIRATILGQHEKNMLIRGQATTTTPGSVQMTTGYKKHKLGQ